jgi:hypothetical protein
MEKWVKRKEPFNLLSLLQNSQIQIATLRSQRQIPLIFSLCEEGRRSNLDLSGAFARASIVTQYSSIPVFHYSIVPVFHHSNIPMFTVYSPNRSPTFKSTNLANSTGPTFSPLSNLSFPIFMKPPDTAT